MPQALGICARCGHCPLLCPASPQEAQPCGHVSLRWPCSPQTPHALGTVVCVRCGHVSLRWPCSPQTPHALGTVVCVRCGHCPLLCPATPQVAQPCGHVSLRWPCSPQTPHALGIVCVRCKHVSLRCPCSPQTPHALGFVCVRCGHSRLLCPVTPQVAQPCGHVSLRCPGIRQTPHALGMLPCTQGSGRCRDARLRMSRAPRCPMGFNVVAVSQLHALWTLSAVVASNPTVIAARSHLPNSTCISAVPRHLAALSVCVAGTAGCCAQQPHRRRSPALTLPSPTLLAVTHLSWPAILQYLQP